MFSFFFSILLINGAMLEDGSKNVKPIFDGEQDWIGPVSTYKALCRVEIVEKQKF